MFDPTPEQQRLIEVIKAKDIKAIAIEAGPGCGKSSTLVMLSSYITDKGQMTCFGADIRKELNAKLKGTDFDAKTFNSIGWSTMRKELKRIRGAQPTFDEMKTDEAKYYKLADKAIDGTYGHDYGIPALLIPDNVKREAVKFIERLTYFCMVTMTDNTDIKDLALLIETYDFAPSLDLPDEIKAEALEEEIRDYGLDNLSAFMSLGEKVIKSEMWMTFTDQIYYTVKWKLRPWATKYLFIDEAQDISEMELQLLSKCVRSGGYVVIVGDPHQSIMQFKGAMTGSFQRTVKFFDAQVFPLSATFRCPRRVVRLANLVKPSLQPFFDKEGIIERRSPTDLIQIVEAHKDGELAIIARTTAPLVTMCLDLIGKGIPATVLGRDIGKELNTLLDKIADTAGYTFKDLIPAITLYKKTHVERMAKKMTDEREIEAFVDTLKALTVVAKRYTDPSHHQPADTLDQLKSRIDDLFAEPQDTTSSNIIKLMTAHKSKGMEFDTVIVHNDFRIGKVVGENRVTSMPIEETYVWFVAITRTQNHLVILDEKMPDWLFGHLPGQPGYELPPFTSPTEQPIEQPDVVEEEPEAIEPPVQSKDLTPQAKIAQGWAQQLLTDGDFVILDTETTGLKGEIIQLAVCDAQGNALINTLIKPLKYEIEEGAMKVHGITPDRIKDAPTFREVLPTLVDIMDGKHIIAYNEQFDRQMVVNSCDTNGLPHITHKSKTWQCAMLRYCGFNPEKITPWGKKGAWWKLEEALQQENIDTTGVDFHNAMADVRATLAIMQAMAGQPITAFNGSDTPLPLKPLVEGKFKHGETVLVKAIKRKGIIHAYLQTDQKYSVHMIEGNRKGKIVTYSESSLQSLYQYDAPIGPEDTKIIAPLDVPDESENKVAVGDSVTLPNGTQGEIKEISEHGVAAVKTDAHTATQTGVDKLTTVNKFKQGTKVKIKSINAIGTIHSDDGKALISVKLDSGQYMAYPRKDIVLVIDKQPTQPKLMDATTDLDQPPKVAKTPTKIVTLPKPKKLPAKVRKQVQSMMKSETVTVNHIDEMIALLQELREEKVKEMV